MKWQVYLPGTIKKPLPLRRPGQRWNKSRRTGHHGETYIAVVLNNDEEVIQRLARYTREYGMAVKIPADFRRAEPPSESEDV